MKLYEANPYGVDVYLYTDITEWKQDNRDSVKGCSGLTVWTKYGIAVWVGDGLTSTLVHELAHVGLYIMEYVGIDVTQSNGEPFAYLLDNMFSYFLGEVNGS